jgi:hypothetical protein
VVSTLNLKLNTQTPPNSPSSSAQPWVSQTPNNLTKALLQTASTKTQISRYQSSSPTPIYEATDQFTKGVSKVMHQLVLLKAENQRLRQANEVLSKRRRANKARL